jgi:hypothetical protein
MNSNPSTRKERSEGKREWRAKERGKERKKKICSHILCSD